MMNLFENLQKMSENVTKLSNKDLIKTYANKLSDEEKEEYDVKNILTNIDSLADDDNEIEDLAIAIQDNLLDDNVNIKPATDGTSDWFIYNESVLKEYKSDINNKDELWNELLRYTDNEEYVSFNDLFNCFPTDDLRDLYDYLSSEYEDEEIAPYEGTLNTNTDIWNAMTKLLLPEESEQVSFNDLFNCFSIDQLKTLYDFMSSEYFDVDDYDEEFESKQLTESHDIINDRKRMEYVVDVVNSLDKYLNNVDEISESLSNKITKLYNMCSFLESIDEIKESTSGIGGAYTTKAIDICPDKNKLKESTKDDYLIKINSEKSNVELVNILHKVRANKGLSTDDRKELEDKIRAKVKSIKTEAITEFYGKDFSDDEIKDLVDKYKKQSDDIYLNVESFNFEGKTYYTVSEGKQIVFEGKECIVYLTVDDELNRYLSYFEYTLFDDGDAESGPQDLQVEIAKEPFKVIAV